MLSICWVFLTLTICMGCAKIKVYVEPQSVKELKRYTSELENNLGSPYYFIGVSGTNRSCSRDVSEGLFNWSKKIPFIIKNERGRNKTVIVIHFLDFIEEMNDTLYNHPFKNHHAKMLFILCNPVHEIIWIEDAGRRLWKKNIVDFFFIYYTTQVEVVTYNEFAANKIINYTNIPVVFSKLFGTKTRNLNGYHLYTKSYGNKHKNSSRKERWSNGDNLVIKDIMQHINASLKSIPRSDSAGDSNFESSGSLSLTTRFMRDLDNDTRKSEFTYPFNLDACVVIVPKGEPLHPYMNLVYTLQMEVWICLLFTLVCIIFTFYVIDKVSGCPGQEDPVLQTVRVMANLPSLGLARSVISRKCLIIFMLWFSILISTAFHTSLTSALMKDRYGKDINTLKELEDSKLKIMVPRNCSDMVPNSSNLHKQFLNQRRGSHKLLSQGNTSFAYVMDSIESAASKLSQVSEKFKAVEEYLVPGLKGYEFPKGSPYLKIVNKLLAMYHEHGLIQHITVKGKNLSERHEVLSSKTRSAANESHFKILTLHHLQASFYVLIIGYSLSIVALFFEILIYKCYVKKEKNVVIQL